MGFSKMLGLLQIKSKGSIVLVNAGSFYIARGKDAFVVPGNIYSRTSDGTNFLIKEGAIPVTSYKDIIEGCK